MSVEVPTGGKHVLRWEYRKDGATSYAPDCVWVDQVQWSPADGSGYTLTSPEPLRAMAKGSRGRGAGGKQ